MGYKVAIEWTGEFDSKRKIIDVFGSDALLCGENGVIDTILLSTHDGSSLEANIGDYVCINECGKYEVIKK